MAKGFSAPRFSSARAVTIRRHWDKEMIVVRRERHHPQAREIRVTFEPSRLSLAWTVQAYEQVMPIVRRTTMRPARRERGQSEEAQRHPSSGVSASLA
jgi:hypothetical protein